MKRSAVLPMILTSWVLLSSGAAEVLELQPGAARRVAGLALEVVGTDGLQLEVTRVGDGGWRVVPLPNSVAAMVLVGLPPARSSELGQPVALEQQLSPDGWQPRRGVVRGGLVWTALRLQIPSLLRVADPGARVVVVGEQLSSCDSSAWGSGVALVAPAGVTAELGSLARRFVAVLNRYRASGFRAPWLRRQPLVVRGGLALCGAYEVNLSVFSTERLLVNSESYGSYAPMSWSVQLTPELTPEQSEVTFAHEVFHATQSAYGLRRTVNSVWLEEGLAALAGVAYGRGPAWGGVMRDSMYPPRSLEVGLEASDGFIEYRAQDFWAYVLKSSVFGASSRPRFSGVRQLLEAGVRDLATLKRFLSERGASLELIYSEYAVAALNEAARRSELAAIAPSVRRCDSSSFQLGFTGAFGAALDRPLTSTWSLRVVVCERLESARVTLSPELRVIYLAADFTRLGGPSGALYAVVFNTGSRGGGAVASFDW